MNFVEDPIITRQLYPFSLTRALSEMRIGILTIREKWERSEQPISEAINPSILPTYKQLLSGPAETEHTLDANSRQIRYPWHIFQLNDWAIREDFVLITTGRQSQEISATNHLIAPANIFLEEGVKMEHCYINASNGPVYIGRNAEIMEGTMLRGPLAICDDAVIKMGTRIYGATTIGPHCIVGGEVKNCVFFGYSNKAHDGYLGDSVIGEWCNLGAGTTNSNLKNNAGVVNVWDETSGGRIAVGQKCGLLMGDYSRSAINTAFNTGTITGVCCNIFGEGMKGPHIPSFSWCGPDTIARYQFDKAVRDIDNWKKLKKHSINDAEIARLRHIFDNY